MPTTNRSYRRPYWRLPPGVARGTWEYTQRESIAADYAEFLKHTPLISIDLKLMLASLPVPKPNRTSRVIDLGCGDGRALRELWQHGYDVLGIDLSQPMLNRVTEELWGDDIGSRLVRANVVQLECLQDEIADHAICLFSTIGMIQGRVHRRAFIKHLARVVKPGGTLVLHVHNRNDAWRDIPSAMGYLKSAWKWLSSRGCELGDRTYAYRGLADMFLHTYSLAELRCDLRQNGWLLKEVISISSMSDLRLAAPWLLPSFRAGGFIAIGHRETCDYQRT